MPFQKGHPNYNLKVSEETRKKISKSHKGIRPSEETKRKIGEKNKGKKRTKEARRKRSEAGKGKKCHFWKGGKTKENQIIRAGIEYRLWREKVFKRDNYTCWICGLRGGKIHPHHLKKFSDYPELRFTISNGLTLCKFCHQIYTNFGGRKKASEFASEFGKKEKFVDTLKPKHRQQFKAMFGGD